MIEESKLGYYLSPILKVWLFMFFLLLCAIPFVMIAQLSFLPQITYPLLVDVLVQVCLVLVVLGALLMMFKVLPPLDFYSVFIKREYALPDFFKGMGIGVGIMLLCAAILYFNGNVSFEKTTISWSAIGLYLVYFLLVSIFEEFLFRTYPLFAMAERYPLWFVVFVNGLLFAFAHFANPGITILGMVNIALAGMFFAIYTLKKQSIAWVVGVHFSWNFTQAIVLGYHVSGNDISGILKAVPKGLPYLSGGEFGIEGSVFCTLLLVLLIVWTLYRNGFKLVEVYAPQLESDDEEQP